MLSLDFTPRWVRSLFSEYLIISVTRNLTSCEREKEQNSNSILF